MSAGMPGWRLPVWLVLFGLCGVAPALAQTPDLGPIIHVCEQCHGPNGNSREDLIPSLAGIRPDYFIGAMGDFADGYRPSRKVERIEQPSIDMQEVAAKLSPETIEALAYHFSDQTFVAYPQSADAELAAAGARLHKRYCDRCHSHGGRAADDGAAVLAGQPMGYLRYTFRNFLSGKRYVSSKMKLKFNAMYRRAGDAGIEQLVHFYGSRTD